MPVWRGLVPPAIVTSTIVMIVCCAAWGALGVLSFAVPDGLSTAAHRYVSILLATVTMCSAMVHLAARVVRALRVEPGPDLYAAGLADGHAAGYAEGLDARPVTPVSPAIPRLSRSPR